MPENFADNSLVSDGRSLASDVVNNVVIPRIKLQVGVDGAAADVSSSNPLPVSLPTVSTSLVNKSGTITSGGVAQTLCAANSSRIGFCVQNVSSENLWINELGSSAAATQPSLLLSPGSLYEAPASCVSKLAISIFGATTGQAFSAREW